MSDDPSGPGWWRASDGKWYAPELHPDVPQLESPVFPTATDPVFPTATDPVFPTATDPVFPTATEPVFPTATDPVFPTATEGHSMEYPSVQYPDVPSAVGPAKSRVAAGLFAILLGWLGVHRFYLGYKVIGIVMLLLTVLSLGVLVPVTFIWGVVEGVLILAGKIRTDKQGVPLK